MDGQNDLTRSAELAAVLGSRVEEIERRLKNVVQALNHANELADSVLDKLRRAEEKDFE